MANVIRQVMAKHFEQDIIEKSFNGNSIRKTWETYVFYNKQNMSQDELAFHQTQSAHRKETAEGHYVKHSTEASDFYHNTLKRAVKKLKVDNGSLCSTPSHDTPCSSRDKPSSSRELPRPSRDTPCSSRDEPSSSHEKPRSSGTPMQTSQKLRSTTPATPDDAHCSTPVPLSSKSTRTKKRPKLSSEVSISSKDPPDVSSDEYNSAESSCASEEATPVLKNKKRKKFNAANNLSDVKVDREGFVKTLTTWRKKEPSDEERNAINLFRGLHYRIFKEEALNKIEEAGIKLSTQSKNVVYTKLKWACNQHLPLNDN